MEISAYSEVGGFSKSLELVEIGEFVEVPSCLKVAVYVAISLLVISVVFKFEGCVEISLKLEV